VTAAERRLESFIKRFTPEIAADARVALGKMRALVPGALELVYDNYNALVVGFGPSSRASEAVFSIVIHPSCMNLFFLQGAGMPDPDGVLEGNGKVVRRLRLATQTTIDEPAVRRAIMLALDLARVPIDPKQPRGVEIRAVNEKQRPRRPTPKRTPAKRNGDRR
jgi:hypothetical protein